EWGSYTPRFGLYTVDVVGDNHNQGAGLTRTPTDGAVAYQTLIGSHGVPDGYRPTRPPAACADVDPAANSNPPVTSRPQGIRSTLRPRRATAGRAPAPATTGSGRRASSPTSGCPAG